MVSPRFLVMLQMAIVATPKTRAGSGAAGRVMRSVWDMLHLRFLGDLTCLCQMDGKIASLEARGQV